MWTWTTMTKKHIGTQSILLPKINFQEELNQYLQVLVKEKVVNAVPVNKPIVNKLEVKLSIGKHV